MKHPAIISLSLALLLSSACGEPTQVDAGADPVDASAAGDSAVLDGGQVADHTASDPGAGTDLSQMDRAAPQDASPADALAADLAAVTDQAATDLVVTDQAATDLVVTDLVVTDQAATDLVATDQAPSSDAPVNRDRAVRRDLSITPQKDASSKPDLGSSDRSGVDAPLECQVVKEGSWNITSDEAFVDCEIHLHGNVNIYSTGSLTLENSVLRFHNITEHGYLLIVHAGGSLTISNSVVTGPLDHHYSVEVRAGATFSMTGSTLENAGWKDQADNHAWIGPAYTNDTSSGGHGLEIAATVTAFTGNTIRNVASVRFLAGSNRVTSNTVIAPRHEGFAFFGDNNEVDNNVIRDAAVLHREIYALRFYPGSDSNHVHHNQIHHVTTGIGVCQIAPWGQGASFNIHNNTMTEVVIGINGALRNSQIHDEVYRDLASHGMDIAGESDNVDIYNCLIEDVTYVAEELYRHRYFREIHDEVEVGLPVRFQMATYDFTLRRGGISIGWDADRVKVRNSTFRRIPFHGFGVTTDLKYIGDGLSVTGNSFEHIGDQSYLTFPGVPVNPKPDNVTPIPGIPLTAFGAVELEHVQDMIISGNTFTDCPNGIVSDFSDSIGISGNLDIKNNTFTGMDAPGREVSIDNWAWPTGSDDLVPRDWIYEDKGVTDERTRAILLGAQMWAIDHTPERLVYFRADALWDIQGNEINGWYYPLVLDNDPRETEDNNITITTGTNQISGWHTIHLYTDSTFPYSMAQLCAANTVGNDDSGAACNP